MPNSRRQPRGHACGTCGAQGAALKAGGPSLHAEDAIGAFFHSGAPVAHEAPGALPAASVAAALRSRADPAPRSAGRIASRCAGLSRAAPHAAAGAGGPHRRPQSPYRSPRGAAGSDGRMRSLCRASGSAAAGQGWCAGPPQRVWPAGSPAGAVAGAAGVPPPGGQRGAGAARGLPQPLARALARARARAGWLLALARLLAAYRPVGRLIRLPCAGGPQAAQHGLLWMHRLPAYRARLRQTLAAALAAAHAAGPGARLLPRRPDRRGAQGLARSAPAPPCAASLDGPPAGRRPAVRPA